VILPQVDRRWQWTSIHILHFDLGENDAKANQIAYSDSITDSVSDVLCQMVVSVLAEIGVHTKYRIHKHYCIVRLEIT